MSIQDPKSLKMMKVKIPYKLKEKFLNLEGLIVKNITEEFSDPWLSNTRSQMIVDTKYSIELNLAGDSTCFSACVEWYRIIQTYYKTSYKAFRIDIGPYKGIYPVSIDENGRVFFELEDVDLDYKNWKDWFVKEDFIYAPEQSA